MSGGLEHLSSRMNSVLLSYRHSALELCLLKGEAARF